MPHAAAAKKTITDCLAALRIDVPIIDRVGRYPSPTVLVDGVDVMRPEAEVPIGDASRLDLPTTQRVLDVLRAKGSSQIESLTMAEWLTLAAHTFTRGVIKLSCGPS
jgi:hypothetical protein